MGIRINKIHIENFKGIKNFSHDFNDKTTTVITGNVGAGKTSFIEAVKSIISDENPDNPISTGEKSAYVSANVITTDKMNPVVSTEPPTEYFVEKDILTAKRSVYTINGRKTGKLATEKSLTEGSADGSNFDFEMIKLAASTSTVANMSNQDFAKVFFGSEDKAIEKKDIDDLIKIMVESELKEKTKTYDGFEELYEEDKLPPDVEKNLKSLFKSAGKDFNVLLIQDAFDEAKKIRRDKKAVLNVSNAKIDGFDISNKPEWDEKTLQKNLEEILAVEKNISILETQMETYKNAVAMKKIQDDRLNKIDFELSMSGATMPDPKKIAEIVVKLEERKKDLVEQTQILGTLETTNKWMRDTISKLDTTVCPISKKLICNTDKTVAKKEITDELARSDRSIAIVKNTIIDINAVIKNLEDEKTAYKMNEDAWKKENELKKEKAKILDKLIVIPEKPEKILTKKDYSIEKQAINEKLNVIRDYKELIKEYKANETYKRDVVVYDFIVKSLDPKGPVVEQFIDTLISPIEDICNDRASELLPDLKIKLKSENGIKFFFDFGKGNGFLPIESLSSGEKIFAHIILTDLINFETSSGCLIVDNTDHLDKEHFKMMMDFITDINIADYYDNVIISAVNHDDILKIIDTYKDIDRIKM